LWGLADIVAVGPGGHCGGGGGAFEQNKTIPWSLYNLYLFL